MPALFPTQIFVQQSVTPTVDTSIYANNDQLGSLMTFPNLLGPGKAGQLVHLRLLDKAAQSALITVLFFSSQPTITSSDNAALNIADAEMDKCCGSVVLTAANYVSTSANSAITFGGTAAIVTVPFLFSTVAGGTIWAIMKSGGTPTYGSASDLVLSLGVLQVPAVI